MSELPQTAVMSIRISRITVGNRHRKEMGDIAELAKSIHEMGLLQPIGIDSNYRLIYGERRLRAFESLGLESIPGRVVHVPSLLAAEHAENEIRKDFTPSERVAIARALEEEIGNRQGQRTDIKRQLPDNCPEVRGRESREIAAEKAGFGSDQEYRRAKTVTEHADPDLIGAMDRGEIAISTAAILAKAPIDVQREAVETPSKAPELAKHVRGTFGTGENEWYTPAEYLKAAIDVMGGFDLDPATNPHANEKVKAKAIFTKADSGLEKEWHGNVWLNPPYAQPFISEFAEKMASEWESGRVNQAIVLTHNYTDTKWFHRLANACNAICFTRGRVKFYSPDGDIAAPTQGQAFFYFGDSPDQFCNRFRDIGFVVEVIHV